MYDKQLQQIKKKKTIKESKLLFDTCIIISQTRNEKMTIFEEIEASVILLANGIIDKFYVSINNITLFKGWNWVNDKSIIWKISQDFNIIKQNYINNNISYFFSFSSVKYKFLYQNFITIIPSLNFIPNLYISYISHNEIKNIYGVFMICWFGKFYVKYIYIHIYIISYTVLNGMIRTITLHYI